MSTEVQLQAWMTELGSRPGPGVEDGDGRFDSIRFTAADRPDGPSLPPPVDPAADHLSAEVAGRRADVEEKHRRVISFLDEQGYDALILTRADSLAWFTAGGDLGQDLGSDAGSVALFINPTCRTVLCDNVQGPRVFEEELAGLGFQLKERPWQVDPSRVISELTHSRKVAADAHLPNSTAEDWRIRRLRTPLSALDRETLRDLGRALALAIEATCRSIQPGETEADVAGQLAHRLIREGVVPVDLRVAGDDRLARFRQPTFKAAPIERRATIAAVGRRGGLCASATRVVSFGPVDGRFRECHTVASMVDATCIYFSRPGEPISEVFRRARRIYEKFDHAHEWTLDYQGSFIGHGRNEGLLRPDCSDPLVAGSAVCWSPSIGAARSEDTLVIDDLGFEVVTEAHDWPKIDVSVKGYPIPRPGILER